LKSFSIEILTEQFSRKSKKPETNSDFFLLIFSPI